MTLTLKDFLIRASNVTAEYVHRNGDKPWSIEVNQMAKTLEELNEMMLAPSSSKELEEGWDVIFTILTRFHLRGYDTYAIMEAALATLKKLENRVGL